MAARKMRKGLLQAALEAGNEVTIKKGTKRKGRPTVAMPKVEYNKRTGKGLDAYSPRRKRRNRLAQPKVGRK